MVGSRAGMEKDPAQVAAMFDGVAKRYDLTDVILSGGQDKRWRIAMRRTLDLSPGDRVLDVAAGTGVSTAELAKSGAFVVGADFSLGMLRAGKAQRRDVRRLKVPLVAADALALPFADATFDAVTISFGLRNVVRPAAALKEFARVTRPGGQLLISEFSTPTWAPLRLAYSKVALRALPSIAKVVSSNPDAYSYLADSINAWPDQESLAVIIGNAGWTQARWRNLTGGIVALHHATKA